MANKHQGKYQNQNRDIAIINPASAWVEEEVIEGDIELTLHYIKFIENDLGQYSVSFHQYLENLKEEIDFRLKTGLWMDGGNGE